MHPVDYPDQWSGTSMREVRGSDRSNDSRLCMPRCASSSFVLKQDKDPGEHRLQEASGLRIGASICIPDTRDSSKLQTESRAGTRVLRRNPTECVAQFQKRLCCGTREEVPPIWQR